MTSCYGYLQLAIDHAVFITQKLVNTIANSKTQLTNASCTSQRIASGELPGSYTSTPFTAFCFSSHFIGAKTKGTCILIIIILMFNTTFTTIQLSMFILAASSHADLADYSIYSQEKLIIMVQLTIFKYKACANGTK